MDKIEEFLNTLKSTLLGTVPGSSLVLADRDGFVLGKLIDKDSMVENVIDNSLLSTFSLATDQASKLHFGKNKSIISFFDDRVVVHFNVTNIVLAVVADSNANVGILLGSQNEIIKSLNQLSNSLDIQDM
eukprot:gene1433-1807_t